MKQYGRQRQHPGDLPDNHPQKGYVNWWERDCNKGSKKRARQQAAVEIEDEVAEFESKIMRQSFRPTTIFMNEADFNELLAWSKKEEEN